MLWRHILAFPSTPQVGLHPSSSAAPWTIVCDPRHSFVQSRV